MTARRVTDVHALVPLFRCQLCLGLQPQTVSSEFSSMALLGFWLSHDYIQFSSGDIIVTIGGLRPLADFISSWYERIERKWDVWTSVPRSCLFGLYHWSSLFWSVDCHNTQSDGIAKFRYSTYLTYLSYYFNHFNGHPAIFEGIFCVLCITIWCPQSWPANINPLVECRVLLCIFKACNHCKCELVLCHHIQGQKCFPSLSE